MLLERISKRDGTEVAFNLDKIVGAIRKAAAVSGEEAASLALPLARMVTELVEEQIRKEEIRRHPTVEEVQDAVERILMNAGLVETAKAYILYRAERTRVREMNTRLMRTYEDLTYKEAEDSDIKRENANIDGNTAMGTMLKYGSEGAKQFNELFILKPEHSEAHKQGDIHIHDLDFLTLTTTCCQIDLERLFAGGFGTGHGRLREPNDIRSYSALACIAIQSNQNDQHGGQSIPNFDYAMSKGVAKTYTKLYHDNLKKLLQWKLELTIESLERVLVELKELEMAGKGPIMGKPADAGLLKLLDQVTGNSRERTEQLLQLVEKQALAETETSTFQAMEALIHNLNTMHSRAGAQIPFSSINYGTDTSPEGRMVIRCVLLATERGLGRGETPIFPIQIFRVQEGVNYNSQDPNYDLLQLACRVSAKRLFPNFSFQDAPFNKMYYKPGRPETEISYMGCRTRVIGNIHDPEREITFGRGNLSFTTLNLPRIALRHRGDVQGFMDELYRWIEETLDQLLHRYQIQGRKKVKNFPFLMGQGIWIDAEKLSPEDSIEEVIKHGSLSVGFIGLAECLKALIGCHHGESEEARQLGLRIITAMREYLDEISLRTKLNFTLLATPAEGTAGRFVRMDRKLFGTIEGITDRDYYTNSFHVPVYYKTSIAEKIRIEAPYHALTNAGHITYVELDSSPVNNIAAMEKIVRIMKESGIGYGSINHPVDRDPVCGYTGVIDTACPSCGRQEEDGQLPFERIRRITGYLVGTLDRFNDAKRSEERDRIKHH